MGKAVIVESIGEALYRVRLDYHDTPLTAEIARLEALENSYWTRVLTALEKLEDIRREKAEAMDGMNEVIQQWIDALITLENEAPPPIPPFGPNDPETGQPWEDEARAQEAPLLDLINTHRGTALTRNDQLDTAILRHVRSIAATGQVRHSVDGMDARNRAIGAGYFFDPAIGVVQVMAYGPRTPAATVAVWQRRSSDWSDIMDEDYTECGVAHVYAPGNPYSYLWGVVLAAPGPELPESQGDQDAIEESADTESEALEKIELPTVETFQPKKLSEVAAIAAIAAQRVRAAERAFAELRLEHIERDKRLAALEKIKAAHERIYDVWACQYDDLLAIGQTASIAEIPGYWQDTPVPKTTILPGDRRVNYDERPINLIPPGIPSGKLQASETLSDAAMFVNTALEPGHLRWKPTWRYGIITAIDADVCSLILTAETGSAGSDGVEYPLDSAGDLTLTGVPISYPPCNGQVFVVDDEVLVLFEGQLRDHPKVIGFRREPRPCPQGRVSWRQS